MKGERCLMQKGPYVEDILEKQPVEGIYLVRDKNNGITKNGKPYIALNLSDKTGIIKGRIWDNADKLDSGFDQGDVVYLKSFSVLYQGDMQLNVHAIKRIAEEDVDLCDFMPVSPLDPEQGYTDIQACIATVNDPHLRRLLEMIFEDERIVAAFKKAPAAKSIHHDCLGGLIEHTLSVTRIADMLAGHYSTVDRDLLVTGAVLHDIGKIYELSYERSFDYTDEGRLIGHIVMGMELISDTIKGMPDFPVQKSMLIKHMILSHHGQLEFGSPKRPKIPEALLLSYIDDIDAKMFDFTQFIQKEQRPETNWTGYHRLFNRYLYTGAAADSAVPVPEAKNGKPPKDV
jgi:3'-5' exoribonuclease